MHRDMWLCTSELVIPGLAVRRIDQCILFHMSIIKHSSYTSSVGKNVVIVYKSAYFICFAKLNIYCFVPMPHKIHVVLSHSLIPFLAGRCGQ